MANQTLSAKMPSQRTWGNKKQQNRESCSTKSCCLLDCKGTSKTKSQGTCKIKLKQWICRPNNT